MAKEGDGPFDNSDLNCQKNSPLNFCDYDLFVLTTRISEIISGSFQHIDPEEKRASESLVFYCCRRRFSATGVQNDVETHRSALIGRNIPS